MTRRLVIKRRESVRLRRFNRLTSVPQTSDTQTTWLFRPNDLSREGWERTFEKAA